MKYPIVALLLTIVLSGCSSTSIQLSSAAGEFQNILETSQQRVEVRTGNEKVYSYTLVENNDNPSDNVPHLLALQGAGASFNNFSTEAAVNDEHFLWTIRYDHNTQWGEAFGGFTHLDKWSGKNSKSKAFIGTGWSFVDQWIIGGWYEVGDVEQRYTNDLYGIYLKYQW